MGAPRRRDGPDVQEFEAEVDRLAHAVPGRRPADPLARLFATGEAISKRYFGGDEDPPPGGITLREVAARTGLTPSRVHYFVELHRLALEFPEFDWTRVTVKQIRLVIGLGPNEQALLLAKIVAGSHTDDELVRESRWFRGMAPRGRRTVPTVLQSLRRAERAMARAVDELRNEERTAPLDVAAREEALSSARCVRHEADALCEAAVQVRKRPRIAGRTSIYGKPLGVYDHERKQWLTRAGGRPMPARQWRILSRELGILTGPDSPPPSSMEPPAPPEPPT